MELVVLNTNLEPETIFDTFESLLWVDRFNKFGDFEIYMSIENANASALSLDYYLQLRESEHVMIIESHTISSDSEEGVHLTVTGRSLESILDRRIVWGQVVLSGNLQSEIHRLLNENVISPEIPERTIFNLIFEESDDPMITELTIDAQFAGEDLYEAISSICEVYDIGFKITLTDAGEFKFKLHSGVDRSYDQLINPYVIFSPKFDGIINSNYVLSKMSLKTATLVVGEGEGAARESVVVSVDDIIQGLDRREIFTDAGSISKTVDGGTLTTEEYLAQLSQKGMETLTENTTVQTFEGMAESSMMFEYGRDYFMGDVVQIVNEYGIESKVRVIEFIRSQGTSGIDLCPTFVSVE